MTNDDLSVTVRIEPVLVGVKDAGRMLGVSAKTIRRMIAAGGLPTVLVGPGDGQRLLAVANLKAWTAGLAREQVTWIAADLTPIGAYANEGVRHDG